VTIEFSRAVPTKKANLALAIAISLQRRQLNFPTCNKEAFAK
jgi:hypothetical protein